MAFSEQVGVKQCAAQSMKILTIGPPYGNLASLVTKTSAIEAKYGPFHALFVTGDFFSSSDSLNEEETRFFSQNADQTDLRLLIPTYISYARQTPPPQVLEKIRRAELNSPSTSKKSPTHSQDSLPVKIAHNLFWLGKDRVNWVSRDDPPNTALAARVGSNIPTDHIVNEAAEHNGLRVAVCGGQWDKEEWAREIQGIVDRLSSTAKVDPENANPTGVDGLRPYVSPSSLEQMYGHRSFQPVQAGEDGSVHSTREPPQTLAAARQALLAGNADQAGSSSHPSIDVLLLSSWPSGISLFSKTFPPAGLAEEARTWGLPPFAEAARRSCPRYIFAPTAAEADSEYSAFEKAKEHGVFWEREPYFTPVAFGSSANHAKVTRFVSLAKFGNAEKLRWFVALKLALGSSIASEMPKNATSSPFGPASVPKRKVTGANGAVDEKTGLESDMNFRWMQGAKGKRQRQGGGPVARWDDGPPPADYVCRICGSQDHYVRLCPYKHRRSAATGPDGLPSKFLGTEEALGPCHPHRAPVEMVGPSDCWFCLSNTGCAKHLVVAIGNESYVALPKGQLPPAGDAASPVPGGGHVLIVPIAHTPSLEATGQESFKTLKAEIETYLTSLAKAYESYDCTLVCWSIVKMSNTRAGHLQIQCVPVPEARIVADPKGPGALLPFLLGEAKARGWGTNGDSGLVELPQCEAGTDGNRLALHNQGDEYFELHVSTPAGSAPAPSKTFVLDLSSRRIRFDYQFARTSLAKYLGVPQRADWRACARASDRVEATETRVFRDAYREFMPDDDDDDDDDDD